MGQIQVTAELGIAYLKAREQYHVARDAHILALRSKDESEISRTFRAAITAAEAADFLYRLYLGERPLNN